MEGVLGGGLQYIVTNFFTCQKKVQLRNPSFENFGTLATSMVVSRCQTSQSVEIENATIKKETFLKCLQ